MSNRMRLRLLPHHPLDHQDALQVSELDAQLLQIARCALKRLVDDDPLQLRLSSYPPRQRYLSLSLRLVGNGGNLPRKRRMLLSSTLLHQHPLLLLQHLLNRKCQKDLRTGPESSHFQGLDLAIFLVDVALMSRSSGIIYGPLRSPSHPP